MVADTPAGAADCAKDESSLLARAKALRAELSATFDRVLASQGLRVEDVARLVRRLERDPETRRALDAARREACVPPAPANVALRSSAPLPRNPRALRV